MRKLLFALLLAGTIIQLQAQENPVVKDSIQETTVQNDTIQDKVVKALPVVVEPDPIPYDSLEVIDYSRSKDYFIAGVQVSGIKFIQKEVLISLSGLKIGNKITLPGDDVTKVLQKFWGQGLFSDAKITARKFEGDSVWLDIFLLEQ